MSIDSGHTAYGRTLTSEGWIDHYVMGVLICPVVLRVVKMYLGNKLARDESGRPEPHRVNGDLAYALPGGGLFYPGGAE